MNYSLYFHSNPQQEYLSPLQQRPILIAKLLAEAEEKPFSISHLAAAAWLGNIHSFPS